jgi:hypothetical protein
VGLVALGKSAKSAADALVRALKDEAPNVRVAAAEALANLGRDEQALAALAAALQHDSPFIRLRAMNALDRMGRRAVPVLPQMRQARPREKGHVAGYVGRMASYVPKRLEQKTAGDPQ